MLCKWIVQVRVFTKFECLILCSLCLITIYDRKFQYVERRKQKQREAGQLSESDDDEEFDGGMKVPSRIWSKLYK